MSGFISILLYINLSRDLVKMPKWLCRLPSKRLLVTLVLIFTGIELSGCATHSPSKLKPSISKQVAKSKLSNVESISEIEIIPIPEKLPCYRQCQDEIMALKRALAERDALIRNLNIRELGQAQALQETTSEISRAKNKLYRLATQPEAASKIAEVEVAMTTLEQTGSKESDAVFQFLARGLLNAAMVAYEQKDYGNAMNYAAQSSELIDVIANPARQKLESQDTVSSFHIPILLMVTQPSNLQTDPNSRSKVISLLKKNTPLTAIGYYGDWLRIQTINNLSGWIKNQVVDVQINSPSFGE